MKKYIRSQVGSAHRAEVGLLLGDLSRNTDIFWELWYYRLPLYWRIYIHQSQNDGGYGPDKRWHLLELDDEGYLILD